MDSISTKESRVLWSFWISAGLALTGGILPLLAAAGGTNRIAGAAIPYGIAAAAMAVNALTYHRGRPLATSLYFLAGIALVYGMLVMVAVPLRLAVIGICPPAPAVCPPGFESPMTIGEGTGFAVGIAMGTLAILVGFFGLMMLFRIKPQVATPPPTRRVGEPPPERRVGAPTAAPAAEAPAAEAPKVVEPEPAMAAQPVSDPEPTPEAATAAPAPSPKPPPKPRVKRTPKAQAELPAPAAQAELPAPEEPLELPASTSEDTPTSG
jgi:hypothetical protein